MINSYPSIYNLGHAAIADLMKSEVIVEEKIDGSQFSFCKTKSGELKCRSKGVEIFTEAPDGMFKQAVEYVKSIADKLQSEFVYRGEYLSKPRHNALCYSRIPNNYIAIFDINSDLEQYCEPIVKQQMAADIGLESVPVLYVGMINDPEFLKSLLETESMLGGQKIEGVAVKPKNYDLYGRDKKVLMGKFVSEVFKEVHDKMWKADNPKGGDILAVLGARYGTEARWQKAVQHLNERGELENSVKDIGKLIHEIPTDILKECECEIKDYLFKWAWPHIQRAAGKGFPQWYKERLLEKQFESSIEDSNLG